MWQHTEQDNCLNNHAQQSTICSPHSYLNQRHGHRIMDDIWAKLRSHLQGWRLGATDDAVLLLVDDDIVEAGGGADVEEDVEEADDIGGLGGGEEGGRGSVEAGKRGRAEERRRERETEREGRGGRGL